MGIIRLLKGKVWPPPEAKERICSNIRIQSRAQNHSSVTATSMNQIHRLISQKVTWKLEDTLRSRYNKNLLILNPIVCSNRSFK